VSSSLTVTDSGWRKSVLATHKDLSVDDAEELALVYRALGYAPDQIEISDEHDLLERVPA
jgi:hypothetical protein